MTTTVSSTLHWTSDRASGGCRPWRIALSWLFLLGVVLWPGAPAGANEIPVMRIERSADGLLLSAQVRFDLTPAVDEALQKGIPLFFVAEAVLLRDRWYWYDKEVARTTRHMRLSYQPLTRRWRLLVSNAPIGNAGGSLGQNFDTRDEALAVIQRVSGWRIADAQDVEADSRYAVTLRFRLDVSQLPRPFQIGAVGQDDWNIAVTRSLRLAPEAAK